MDVVIGVVVPVEVEVDLGEYGLDGEATNAEQQAVGRLIEGNAHSVCEPPRCEGVFAAAVDQREEG